MAPKTRHQSHKIVNANMRLRGATPPKQQVNISVPGTDHRSVYELDGRLTLIQEREVVWKVKAEIADRDAPDMDALRDPVNQLGPVHSACVPIVTSNDPVSYLAAVNKRSNFKQEGPLDDITDEMFQEACQVIGMLPDGMFDIWDENEEDRIRWLAKFDDAKKKRMVSAWEDIESHTKHELRKKSGSVKIETLVGKRFDESAAGRIILAGTDAFNAVTGPAQMVAMERLVTMLASNGPDGSRLRLGDAVEILLGYKTDDITLAAFIKDDRFREIVEGDFSRNDREQRSRVAHLVDLWFAKLGFPDWYRKLMLDLEKYTLTNREFGLKVWLEYQLATGTTNTTFRNSVYNGTMFAVTCRLQRRRGKALILGDDILAALNKRLDLKEWVGIVADFKMVLKAKAPELDGEATFLSRRCFSGVETPFFLPLIGKMLVRFNIRASQNQQLSDAGAMASKALSYAFGCKNVHHFRDLFLERYELEMAKGAVVDEAFTVSDLGWHARSNGYSLDDIKRRTFAAPNLVDDDQLSQWLTAVYDIDLFDTLELMRETICSDEPVVLENPLINCFERDYL